MAEGCFSSYVTGQLDIIEGRMNATKYKDKLNKNLLTSVNALKKWCATARFSKLSILTIMSLQLNSGSENKINKLLKWFSQSIEMSLKENLSLCLSD